MLKNFISSAVNFLLPSFCMYCKEQLVSNEVFCFACQAKIYPIVSKTITLTTTKTMTVYSVGAYNEPLKSLIMAKKWGDVVACKQMAELIWRQTPFSTILCDALVPIPLHWTRYAWRGYNQAERIAATLSRKQGAPVANILKRSKRTAYQSTLSACQRPGNIKEAFTIAPNLLKKYKDKHLILIDDLMTTGTTLHEAGRQLLKIKPASVTAIVVCRVV